MTLERSPVGPGAGAASPAAPGTGQAAQAAAPARTATRPLPPRRIAERVAFTALLAFFTLLFLYPFVWLLSASFKTTTEVFNNVLIPNPPHPEKYSELTSRAPVLTWAWNSVLVSFLAATTVTISSALVSFAFAYFRFPGRNLLFGLVLATLLLPGTVTMIPQFLIWNFLGFNNSLVPLWAGNLFGSAFYIFLLRQFFLTLP